MGGNAITAMIYCTKQLVQSTPSPDGCDDFADDAEDGVCYQVLIVKNRDDYTIKKCYLMNCKHNNSICRLDL